MSNKKQSTNPPAPEPQNPPAQDSKAGSTETGTQPGMIPPAQEQSAPAAESTQPAAGDDAAPPVAPPPEVEPEKPPVETARKPAEKKPPVEKPEPPRPQPEPSAGDCRTCKHFPGAVTDGAAEFWFRRTTTFTRRPCETGPCEGKTFEARI